VEVVADAGTPTATLTASSLSITCSNPTPSLAVTTNTTVTYDWSPTSGILAGTETTASPTFTAPGTYSLVVTNNSNGCSSSASSNVVTVVNDNSSPVVSLSLGNNTGTINCNDLIVTVTPTVTSANSSSLTYTWTSGSGLGISTPVNQANATFTATGVYTLSVTNTANGCVSSSTTTANTFTVFVDTTAPTATINVASTNTVIGCGAGNSTVTLTGSITSVNPTTINWIPGNISTPSIDVTVSNTYTLIVTDAVNGCSVATQYSVSGNTNPPQNVNAGTNVTMACSSQTVILNGVSTSSNVSYTWEGPSVTSINTGSNSPNPEVNETGIYTLTVTDNLTGCFSTATVNVAQANVTASFTANPTTGASPLTVEFTDASIGATNWNWNFGDSNTSTSQNPSNVYTTGTYTVVLTASSGSCTSTSSVVIVVEDGFSLEIPNVFTPNSDGANDLFTVKSTGVKEISLQIFNRWGEKLYEFTGPKASWDGLSPNGLQVPEGTYFFFIKATGFDSSEVEKQGTINLFR
jgi:gliding motility-associated-like protein